MSSVRRSVIKATALGIAGTLEHTASTSGWMHRSYAHKAVELAKPLDIAGRFSVWKSGVIPRIWATIHRDHHDFADDARDPHSPKILGWKNVLLNNHNYYRRRAKTITPADIPADLQPDALDRTIFDRKHMGLLTGIAIDAAANKLVGNKLRYTPITTITRLVGYVAAGNFVNTIGHLGARPAEAIAQNIYTPHEDGSYGSDSRIIAAATLGEGFQKAHHDDPNSIGFAENRNHFEQLVLDPVGAALKGLIRVGLARPGEGR